MRLGERDVVFEVGDGPGDHPADRRGLPELPRPHPQRQPNRLTVGREPLLEAVRRVRLLAREATPVRLVLKPESVELVAITQDVGQAHEELDAKYDGDELTVAFNPEYLIAGIEVTPGDEITLETIDALKPALVRSDENPDFLYLLMPVRVS